MAPCDHALQPMKAPIAYHAENRPTAGVNEPKTSVASPLYMASDTGSHIRKFNTRAIGEIKLVLLPNQRG